MIDLIHCYRCGELFLSDNDNWCPSCVEEVANASPGESSEFACCHCAREIDEDDAVEIDDSYYCRQCAATLDFGNEARLDGDDRVRCRECDEWYRAEDLEQEHSGGTCCHSCVERLHDWD